MKEESITQKIIEFALHLEQAGMIKENFTKFRLSKR